jgi:hypothetical protein
MLEFFSLTPCIQQDLTKNMMVTIIEKSITAIYVDTVSDFYKSPTLRREPVRKAKAKVPTCAIAVEEQRSEGIGVGVGGSAKNAIAMYQRLNRLGEGKEEDEAIAEAMTELYCSHFRCFARNFNPDEVEVMSTKRIGKLPGPSKVEKRLAQYFAEVLFRENWVNRAIVQERMHLLMPYRERTFVNRLLAIWTLGKNIAIFNENANSGERALFHIIEEQETCFYYGGR